MRIVHVSDAYVPRVGGLETQVRSLAEQQARAGHEVFVLTATLGRTAAGAPLGGGAVENTAGVEIRRLACKLPAEIPVHPRQNSLISHALNDIRPDVVHIHAGMLSPFSFAGIRQALKLKLPIVVTWHSTFTGWSAAFKAKALALKAADQPVKVECQLLSPGTQPSPAGRRPSKPRPGSVAGTKPPSRGRPWDPPGCATSPECSTPAVPAPR